MDKGQGACEEGRGRAVTGDEIRKSEGRADQSSGMAKEKKGKLKDLFK